MYWEHNGSVVQDCSVTLSNKVKLSAADGLTEALKNNFPEIKRVAKEKNYFRISLDMEIDPASDYPTKGIAITERSSTEQLQLTLKKRWEK